MANDIFATKSLESPENRAEAIYRLAQLLNQAEYRDNLVDEALRQVADAVQAERGIFVRSNADLQTFSVITSYHLESANKPSLKEFSSSLLEKVVQTGVPQLYHDVQSDPDLSRFESVVLHQIQSVIGVPIFQKGRVWGVILVDSRRNRANFTEESVRFLRFFSDLVSLALDRIIRYERLADENQRLRDQIPPEVMMPDIIGNSPVMRKLAMMIRKVAQTDATVLLLGESGTGKDLVAQAIHKLSPRVDNPYLAQFCGSIPETLLDSELFGYKKGAFSGANTDKKGLFEVADNGTFFLDEIADIPFSLQVKLLRVLQNQEIIRLGDTRVKKVNVRIIAATNKDLDTMVAEKSFREDLYYRLNVFPVTVPPLRQRPGDVPLLVKHFVTVYGSGQVEVSPAAMDKLEQYSWPGNVRQLQNILQRALIMGGGETLQPEDFNLSPGGNTDTLSGSLKEIELKLLQERLKQFDNNRTRAAESLGVSVRWVQLKLKEMSSGK